MQKRASPQCSKEQPATTRKPLGIGVISLGWMGRVHSRAYANVVTHFPDLQVTPRLAAAADPSKQARADALDILGFERAYADYRELLADLEVDAVSIASPTSCITRSPWRRSQPASPSGSKRTWRSVSRDPPIHMITQSSEEGVPQGTPAPLPHTLICLDKFPFFVILFATGNTRRRFYRDS